MGALFFWIPGLEVSRESIQNTYEVLDHPQPAQTVVQIAKSRIELLYNVLYTAVNLLRACCLVLLISLILHWLGGRCLNRDES